MQLEVTAGQAAGGTRPDIYVPMTVRVDSRGPAADARPRRRADPPHRARDRRDEDPGRRRLEVRGVRVRLGLARRRSLGQHRPEGRHLLVQVGRRRASMARAAIASMKSTRGCRPRAGCRASSSATTGSRIRTGGASARPSGLRTTPGWSRSTRAARCSSPAWASTASRASADDDRAIDRPTSSIRATTRGRSQWWLGSPTGDTPSFSLKFGWDGHNYLGFPDAWGLTGTETDQQLFDLLRRAGVLASGRRRVQLLALRAAAEPRLDRGDVPAWYATFRHDEPALLRGRIDGHVLRHAARARQPRHAGDRCRAALSA